MIVEDLTVNPVRNIDLFDSDNTDDPEIKKFYDALKAIKMKDNVKDVLIEVSDFADDYWPLSERIYIITSSTIDEVTEWVKDLEMDTIVDNSKIVPKVSKSLIEGYKIYCVWWNNETLNRS